MNDTALVSVIVPTYYRNELLHDCLASIINQTYENVETIVVDDSGERHAAEVVDEFDRVTYIPFKENLGPNAARNAGIEASSGDYIQLLDDDDSLDEKKIQRQVSVFEANPEIGVVYCGGWSEAVGDFSPKTGARGDVLRLALQFELTSCVTSTMLIRRDIVEDVYPLPDVRGSDDTFWKIEFARRCNFDFIDSPLVTKRAPDVRRGESKGAVDGVWEILNRYAELYDEFDDDVRQIAESKASKRKALYCLRSTPYSVYAIRLFSRSIRQHPDPSAKHYLQLVASLFGRGPYFRLYSCYKYIRYRWDRVPY